jgi:hypothetical protein
LQPPTAKTGEIVELDSRKLVLRMEDAQEERLVEYARDDWSQLQLAYAITSHRAAAHRVACQPVSPRARGSGLPLD